MLLEIRAAETIGLIGSCGSGKTALVNVRLGLLEPQQGELRYNGRPLKEVLAKWRAQLGQNTLIVIAHPPALRPHLQAQGRADHGEGTL